MEKFSEKAVRYVANYMRLLEEADKKVDDEKAKQVLKDSIKDIIDNDKDRIGLDVYQVVNEMLTTGVINKAFVEYAIKTQTKRLTEFLNNSFYMDNKKTTLKDIFIENFVDLAKEAIKIKKDAQHIKTTFNDLLTPKGQTGSKLSTSIVNTLADTLRFASYNETQYSNSTGRGEFLLDLFFNEGNGSKISMKIVDIVNAGKGEDRFNLEVKSTDSKGTIAVKVPETIDMKKKRPILGTRVRKRELDNETGSAYENTETGEIEYEYKDTDRNTKFTNTNWKYSNEEKIDMIKSFYETIDGELSKIGEKAAKADIKLPEPIGTEYKNSYAARTLFFLIGGESTFKAASDIKFLTSDNKIIRTDAIYGILGLGIRLVNLFDAVRLGIVTPSENMKEFNVSPKIGVFELKYDPITNTLNTYKDEKGHRKEVLVKSPSDIQRVREKRQAYVYKNKDGKDKEEYVMEDTIGNLYEKEYKEKQKNKENTTTFTAPVKDEDMKSKLSNQNNDTTDETNLPPEVFENFIDRIE